MVHPCQCLDRKKKHTAGTPNNWWFVSAIFPCVFFPWAKIEVCTVALVGSMDAFFLSDKETT